MLENRRSVECFLTPDLLHLGRLADLREKNRRINVEALESACPEGSVHVVKMKMIHNDCEFRLMIMTNVGDGELPQDLFLDVDFEDYEKHKSVIHFDENHRPETIIRNNMHFDLKGSLINEELN